MGDAGDLDVHVEEIPGGTALLRVDGELDLATVGRFEGAMATIGPERATVLDLTGCTFLDSSAIRALVRVARASSDAGGSLSLVTGDSALVRVLEIAAVDTMIPVYATLDDAL